VSNAAERHDQRDCQEEEEPKEASDRFAESMPSSGCASNRRGAPPTVEQKNEAPIFRVNLPFSHLFHISASSHESSIFSGKKQ
jgi:hypothetical protein